MTDHRAMLITSFYDLTAAWFQRLAHAACRQLTARGGGGLNA